MTLRQLTFKSGTSSREVTQERVWHFQEGGCCKLVPEIYTLTYVVVFDLHIAT